MVGERVDNFDAPELRALLRRHDEEREKVGSGIDHFEVGDAPDDFGGRCFWIIRTDGSRIDFSFKHCLAPKLGD
ncbi:DCL family protein [Mesorhizobium sp. M0239]|uniref:DCL family protein n=1 Tax=Mesorhizobium sp. M0239 TaxID=2956924 RepID=UPI00333AA22B